MPFKSKEELTQMLQANPVKAKSLVRKAKARGQKVVDEDNSGYSDTAVDRAIQRRQAKNQQQQQMTAKRKQNM